MTQQIKLPPLPEWADATLQGEDRDSLFAWAEAAIKADRHARGEPVCGAPINNKEVCGEQNAIHAPQKQYYYKDDNCTANNAKSPDCICWHDEGCGPLSTEEQKAAGRTWRDKPQPQQTPDDWKAAIDRELVSMGCTTDSFESPEKAVTTLIDWNIAVATDPKVNGGYKLVPVELLNFIAEKEHHLPVEDRHCLRVMLEAAPEPKGKS